MVMATTMKFTRRFLFELVAATFLLVAISNAAVNEDDTAVARIGNQPILARDLDAVTAVKLRKQQEAYEAQVTGLKLGYARARQDYKEKELSDLIDERVLALEAKARKSTPAALTAAVKPADVTDTQMRAFYEANKRQTNQPYETVLPQIKTFLQKQANAAAQQNYLESLRTKYKAVVMLAPLREDVAAIGPQRGPANAPVTIVEFSDFQCPFCGQLAPILDSLLAKYPTQVRLIYRHMPLTELHRNAEKAAEAGVCAQSQGKFWEMHDLMFAEQSSLNVEALKEKARRVGIDATAFDDCLDLGKAKETVRLDGQASNDLGLTSTPASFVNGRFVNGAQSLEVLSAIIEDELHNAERVASR
jgi:protein-disulfide isomerase